jgi:hypothetical protein
MKLLPLTSMTPMISQRTLNILKTAIKKAIGPKLLTDI